MIIFKYSHKGNREVNEDYVVTHSMGDGISLYLIADGMGGYDFGDVASKVVGDSYVAGLSRNMSLEEATNLASYNLKKEQKNLGVKKMGSTVAGVFIKKRDATVFWAGDSRVYIFRDEKPLYQTEDHSLVNELSKTRALTIEEISRYIHLVTRALTGNSDDTIDYEHFSLVDGDEIFIRSDGIYNDCPVDYIIESIRKNCFDLQNQSESFDDNHSLIYIKL